MMKAKFIFPALVFSFIGLLNWSSYPGKQAKTLPNTDEERLCISLARLIKAESFSDTKPAPPGLDTLFGLSLLEGYILDPENNDIILFGKRDNSRRPYNFFDILINFQNVFGKAPRHPECSLDPLPENMLKLQKVLNSKYDSYQAKFDAAAEAVGGQQVYVGGVPRYSNHAAVMIYADYDMKRASQGYEKLPGVRSILQIYKNMPDDQSALSSRFWFHIKPSKDSVTYPNFRYDEGIVIIDACPVIILTEKQVMDRNGNLADKKAEADPVAALFAREFSDNFSHSVLLNPNYCELENLYRLHALFLAMKEQKALESVNFDKTPYFNLQLVPNKGLPKELPGLVNAELIQERNSVLFSIVAGGVSMAMTVTDTSFTRAYSLNGWSKSIQESRSPDLPVYWLARF